MAMLVWQTFPLKGRKMSYLQQPDEWSYCKIQNLSYAPDPDPDPLTPFIGLKNIQTPRCGIAVRQPEAAEHTPPGRSVARVHHFLLSNGSYGQPQFNDHCNNSTRRPCGAARSSTDSHPDRGCARRGPMPTSALANAALGVRLRLCCHGAGWSRICKDASKKLVDVDLQNLGGARRKFPAFLYL